MPTSTTGLTENELESIIERAAIQDCENKEGGVSMAQLLAAAREPDMWILEGLIEREDQVILAGAPKAGKSVLASQIAVAVAQGGKFLRWRAPAAFRVVYVNMEIRRKRFGQRLIVQCGGARQVLSMADNFWCVDRHKTINVLNPVEREIIKKEIEAIGADLVVIDVLARCHNADESSTEMKAVMLALRLISGKAASIIVHHARKAMQGVDVAQTAADMRGSSAIHGEVDMAMVLTKRSGQGARYSLTFSARNVETPSEILLGINDLNFHEAAEEEADKLKDVIQAAFKGSKSILASDLLAYLQNAFLVAERRSQDYIKEAVGKGWIRRVKRQDRRYEYHIANGSPILHIAGT